MEKSANGNYDADEVDAEIEKINRNNC